MPKNCSLSLTPVQLTLLEKVLSQASVSKKESTTLRRILENIDSAKNAGDLVVSKNGLKKQETAGVKKVTPAGVIDIEIFSITDAEFRTLELLEELGGKATANELLTTQIFLSRMLTVGLLKRNLFAGVFDYSLSRIGEKVYEQEKSQR